MSLYSPDKLPRFITVTGQEGSGKDSYADHLAGKGFMHISAGDFIRSVARQERGCTDPIPRSILSEVGDELKARYGSSPITEASLSRYEQEREIYPMGLVISGFRRVGELRAFKARGAVALWIAASDETRFHNLSHRPDQLSWEEFKIRSEQEYHGDTSGGKGGVNLKAVEEMADLKVVNEGTLQELYDNGDEALNL
jgi:dephospho-CoA kinase